MCKRQAQNVRPTNKERGHVKDIPPDFMEHSWMKRSERYDYGLPGSGVGLSALA